MREAGAAGSCSRWGGGGRGAAADYTSQQPPRSHRPPLGVTPCLWARLRPAARAVSSRRATSPERRGRLIFMRRGRARRRARWLPASLMALATAGERG